MPSTECGEQASSSASFPLLRGGTRGGGEGGLYWLSPDRTKLGLLDSDGQGRGRSSDLIQCQALETGVDRMEWVKLAHSLCSLRSHLSG